MAKQLDPIKGEVTVNIEVDNKKAKSSGFDFDYVMSDEEYEKYIGSTRSKRKSNKSSNKSKKATKNDNIKELNNIIQQMEKIEEIDLSKLEKIDNFLKNFGNTTNGQKDIIEDLKEINTQLSIMANNGDKLAKRISSSVTQILESMQGVSRLNLNENNVVKQVKNMTETKTSENFNSRRYKNLSLEMEKVKNQMRKAEKDLAMLDKIKPGKSAKDYKTFQQYVPNIDDYDEEEYRKQVKKAIMSSKESAITKGGKMARNAALIEPIMSEIDSITISLRKEEENVQSKSDKAGIKKLIQALDKMAVTITSDDVSINGEQLESIVNLSKNLSKIKSTSTKKAGENIESTVLKLTQTMAKQGILSGEVDEGKISGIMSSYGLSSQDYDEVLAKRREEAQKAQKAKDKARSIIKQSKIKQTGKSFSQSQEEFDKTEIQEHELTLQKIEKQIQILEERKNNILRNMSDSGVDVEGARREQEEAKKELARKNKEIPEGDQMLPAYLKSNVDEQILAIQEEIKKLQEKIAEMLREKEALYGQEVEQEKNTFNGKRKDAKKIAREQGLLATLPTRQDYDNAVAYEKYKILQNKGVIPQGENGSYSKEQLKAVRLPEEVKNRLGNFAQWRKRYEEAIIDNINRQQESIIAQMENPLFRNLTAEEELEYARLEGKSKIYKEKTSGKSLSGVEKDKIDKAYKLTNSEEKEFKRLSELLEYTQMVEKEATKLGLDSKQIKEANTESFEEKTYVKENMATLSQQFEKTLITPLVARLDSLTEASDNLRKNFTLLTDEIIPTIRILNASKGAAIDTTQPSLTQTWGESFVNEYGETIPAGKRLSVGGTSLGALNNTYEYYQKNYVDALKRKKQALKTSKDKGYGKSVDELKRALDENPENTEVKALYDEVMTAQSDMNKWANNARDLINQIVKIFKNSTEAMQQDFFKKIGRYENIGPDSDEVIQALRTEKITDPLTQVPRETRLSVAKVLEQARREQFDYAEGQRKSSSGKTLRNYGNVSMYEALFNELRDYQYDFSLMADDTELTYGGAKEPWEIEEERVKNERKEQKSKLEEDKEEKYTLESALKAIQSDEFKEILKGENGVQIASSLIQHMFGELENADVQVEDKETETKQEDIKERQEKILRASTADDEVREAILEDMSRGQIQYSTDDDDDDDDEAASKLMEKSTPQEYREYLATKENADDPVQEQVKETMAFQFRRGVQAALKEYEAIPELKGKAASVLSNIGMMGIERGKQATTVAEDERQAYQRISNLFTFADIVDERWNEIATERGVSVEEIRNDALKDEYFKSKYEESSRARDLWKQLGGPSNPAKVLMDLFGVPKEQSELYKQLPIEEVNNIFAALGRLSSSGTIETYKDLGGGVTELTDEASAGLQAVINKSIQRMAIGAKSPDRGEAADFYQRNAYKGIEVDVGTAHGYSPAERTALFHKGGQIAFEVGATNLEQARKNAQLLLEQEEKRIQYSLPDNEEFKDNSRTLRFKEIIAQIDALKKVEKDVVTSSSEGKFQTIEKSMDEQKTSEAIQEETQKFKENNIVVQEHAENIEQASLAEKEKITISSELAKQLLNETNAFKQEEQILDKHVDALEEGKKATDEYTDSIEDLNKSAEQLNDVKIEYEEGEFLGPTEQDPHRHTYRSKKTGEIVDATITQVGGAAFAAQYGQSAEDYRVISNRLEDAYARGAKFDAESLGIINKNTGKVDTKKWENIKFIQKSTMLGTMYHKISELALKYQTDSLEELQNKMDLGDSTEYKKLFEQTSGKMKILGGEFTQEMAQRYLTAYMDKKFPRQKDGSRNIVKPTYSEQPMIMRISKGNESYAIGMQPDAIFTNDYIEVNDLKTGKIHPEKNSLQLAANAYTFQAGVRQGAFENIPKEVADKPLRGSILNYNQEQGIVSETPYGIMSKEELFEIVRAAMAGTPIPTEQKSKYNYESSIGISSSGVIAEEAVLPDKNVKDIASKYIQQLAEEASYTKQIMFLDKEISKIEGQRRVKIQKGFDTSEEDIKLASYRQYQEELQTLRSMINEDRIVRQGDTLSYIDTEGNNKTTILSAQQLQELQEKEDKLVRAQMANEAKITAEMQAQAAISAKQEKNENLNSYNKLLEEQYQISKKILALDEKLAKLDSENEEYQIALREKNSLEESYKNISNKVNNYDLFEENREAGRERKTEWRGKYYSDFYNSQNRIAEINAQKEANSFENILRQFKSSEKSYYDQSIEAERARVKRGNYTGDSQKEIQALENNIAKQRELLALKQQERMTLDENVLKYQDANGEAQEMVLNNEQLAQIQKIQNDLANSYKSKLAKTNATVKESKSLFEQLADGLKRSMTNLIDYSLAGFAIGTIRQTFSQVITQVKELDAALIDLQIAAGTSREETALMMQDYNRLAKELGRTTQEVAVASNDWLRAGYQGQEAAQLTEASMQLSTLGMTDAASATTNLISVMKGWQLQTEDVSSVVDRLTAIDMAAAISAGELAEGMAEGNNAARLAGASLDWYAGIIAATADATQMGATRVGNALTNKGI